jgi:hypothetical protein
MANQNNTLTNVIDSLLARGLLALREQAVMPLLVNRQYEADPGTQGDSISVPLPSAVAVADVTPDYIPPSDTADTTPGTVSIPLNRWKEAAFYLTDQDLTEISARTGFMPMMASEAIRGIANEIDQFILGLGAKFYGVQGTAGTTPFGTAEITDAAQVRKVLNNQVCPIDSRRLVFNPDAEANALELRAFHDASFGVGGAAILEGQITRRLGFDWFMDQNVQTHTAGTGTGFLVNLSPGYNVGDTSIVIDGGGGLTMVEGDVITFASHTQTYVVTNTSDITTSGTMTIQPGLVAAVADDEAITITATHAMNLAFHRDAIAFVSKPLAASSHPGSIIQSAVDPISGIALRLEVTREHKRDRFSYDVLYGAEVVRRELGARLLG